jgi:AcrR family transcriptional regulator
MEAERTQKKEMILDAALDAFLEKGFTGAKMSEIAARAGLAKATLYDYFESKETLFDELLYTKVTLPYLSFEENLDQSASCESRIRHFMHMELEFLFNFMNEKNILPNVLLHTELIANATIASATHRIISFKFRVLSELLREGTERGEFRENDPLMTAACLIGAFNFCAACACKARFANPPFPFLAAAGSEAAVFEILFSGIRAPERECGETPCPPPSPSGQL